MTEYANIRFDVTDKVASIELHRPQAMNAFTHGMLTDLLDALDRVDADDGVRAVIVTGAGDRAFCAGADLTLGAETFSAEKLRHRAAGGSGGVPRDSGGVAALRIYRCRKPVIAAINGVAVGVGATMTLPMDIRIASTTARFGFVFARRGLVPEAASSWFLPRVVGIGRALEWCYTGRVFGPDEALDAGLVRSVHEPDQLMPAARAIATEIAESASAVSITLTRQMLWRMLSASHPMDAHRVDSRAMQALGKSADLREGVNSFLEKRPARFTDRSSTDVPDVFIEWAEPDYS
jgi:enoyl-CoA hydratase/carnithine racemase